MFDGEGGLTDDGMSAVGGGHNDKVFFFVVKPKLPQTFSVSHSQFPSQPAAALDSSSREVTYRDPRQQTPLCDCRRRATRSARSVDLDSRRDAPSISVESCAAAAARIHQPPPPSSALRLLSHGRLLRADQSG